MALGIAGHALTTKTTIADDHEFAIFKPGDDGAIAWTAFITQLVAKFAAGTDVPVMVGDKIPVDNMPFSAFTYKGDFNATTDIPNLTDGSGTVGDFYNVSVAGTINHGAGNIVYSVGDGVAYNGSIWVRVPGLANILNGVTTASGARDSLAVWSKTEQSGLDKSRGGVRLVHSGSSYVTIPNGPFQTPPTGDCTFVWSLSSIVKSSGADYLVESHGSGTQGCYVCLNASGNLELIMRGGATYTVAPAMLPAASYDSAVIVLTVDRDGLATAYLNGVSKGSIDISADAAIDWSLNAVAGIIGFDQAASTLEATYHAFGFATRAMTSAEVLELSRSLRIQHRDAGASTTATYTSNWSAGVDGWTATRATLTAPQTATHNAVEKTNCLRVAANTENNSHGAFKSGIYTIGKSALTLVEAAIPSANTNAGRLKLRETVTLTEFGEITTHDEWIKKAFYHLPKSDGLFLTLATDAGTIAFAGAGGADDFADIASVTIYQAGWTLWMDGATVLGTSWIGHNGVDHKSIGAITGGASVAQHGPVRITTKTGVATTPVIQVFDSVGKTAEIREDGTIIENVKESADGSDIAVGQKWWKTGVGTAAERTVLYKSA